MLRRSLLLSVTLPAAALVVAGSATGVALPAWASIVESVQRGDASQHLGLAPDAADGIVVPPRDDVEVTVHTAVQWPVDPAAAITSPFGPRRAPCAGCSTMHRGVDLVPGSGTPIAAIADGVVTEVGDPSGELGVHVYVQSVVDGATVTSVYGHMILGSMHLAVGDRVARGEIVGRVGSTGGSTGPHLHFGILDAAGDPEDPIAWLGAHATVPWTAPAAG
jgi:murein DD-endopeptidase MepM/ murein hydrolase activator NlpD